jgi:hypothetical protein
MTVQTARSERDVWLELVAAVDYLSVTHRLGMTVCDAIEEAIRTWTAARRSEGMLFPMATAEVPWDDPDPLRSTLADLLAVVEPLGTPVGFATSSALVSALDAWLHHAAERYNAGAPFRSCW